MSPALIGFLARRSKLIFWVCHNKFSNRTGGFGTTTGTAASSTRARRTTRLPLTNDRLGHKSGKETLDTYGHLWPDADEQTRNILNEALT
jgi:hypothetical protein